MAIHSTFIKSEHGKKTMRETSDLFGPGHVDQFVRQALQMLWMMLPKGQRTVNDVEKQFRRIVERALKDFREDASAFGKKL